VESLTLLNKEFAKVPEKILRFAQSDDVSQIRLLLEECQLPSQDINSDCVRNFLTAWDDGKLIGVVGLEIYGETALLRSLAVDGSYRNQGLAYEMCNNIEAYAIRRQITQLYLLTTTAQRFFSRFGFNLINRRHVPDVIAATAEFQSLCPESAICMYKRLEVR
jgi:amino-acid N-acetyltransferase